MERVGTSTERVASDHWGEGRREKERHREREGERLSNSTRGSYVYVHTVDSHYSELEGTSSKVHYIRRFIITRVDTQI